MIIITEKIDLIFIQNAMDFGFVDQIYLSFDCIEIFNDNIRTQLYQLTRTQNYYARFFSIILEYNEDTREYLKAYHLITMNNSEEIRIEINVKKPKKLGYYNRPWTKIRRALGIKTVLGRMTDLSKRNCSVHCAVNNWMIVIGD